MILLYGSSGFIGKKLIFYLKKNNIKFKEVKLFKEKKLIYNHDYLLKLIETNITKHKPNVIINLHAQTDIDSSYNDPCYDIFHNSILNIQILCAIKKKNNKIKFINTGTATQIGHTDLIKQVSFNLPNKPLTIFDLNKQYTEDFMSLYSKKFNLKTINVRLTNVIGFGSTHSNSRGAVNKMISNGIKNKTINIFGSGKYKRDYILVDDVCRGLIKIAKNNKIFEEDFIYMCSGKGTSLLKLSKYIQNSIHKLYNLEIKINLLKKDMAKIDKRSFIGNTQKLEKYLKWKPMKFNERMIFDIVNDFKRSNLI